MKYTEQETKAFESILASAKEQKTSTGIVVRSNIAYAVLDALARKNAISDWWTVGGFPRVSL